MKFIQFILILIVGALVATACEKEVILDIPAGDRELVVEGWIYDGSGPLVMLSRQFAGYGTFNTADLTDSLNIKQAVVEVSENNGPRIQLAEKNIFGLPLNLIEQVLDSYRIPREFAEVIQVVGDLGLTLEDQLAFVDTSTDSASIRLFNSFNFYVDTTGTINGQENSSYQLFITKDDEMLTAETTIPLKQTFNFLTYEIDDEAVGFAQVRVNITVPDNVNAYVLFATKRNSEPYYVPDYLGAGLTDNGIYAGAGTLDLPLFRGYDNFPDETDELGLFEIGDTVNLKWQNIDQATYNFWFSIFNGGGDTPFSSATPIQTNVIGGEGIWAGYATYYDSIIIAP